MVGNYWAISRPVCVLRLVSMDDSRTERLHKRLSCLSVSLTCIYFSRHCYPPVSQQDKRCPRIVAALEWTVKKIYSRGIWSKKYGAWIKNALWPRSCRFRWRGGKFEVLKASKAVTSQQHSCDWTMNHISLKESMPRCSTRSPTVQDTVRPLPDFTSFSFWLPAVSSDQKLGKLGIEILHKHE